MPGPIRKGTFPNAVASDSRFINSVFSVFTESKENNVESSMEFEIEEMRAMCEFS